MTVSQRKHANRCKTAGFTRCMMCASRRKGIFREDSTFFSPSRQRFSRTPPSRLLPHHVTDMSTQPPAFPGETFLHTYPHTKFFLGTPASSTTWASLAAFYGFGTVHLSTFRMLFILDPPSTGTNHLSIPLAWLKRDRLHIRRPFFDTKHISGILVPADVNNMSGSVFTVPGKPMQFRIEMIDPESNDELCDVLRELLADPDRLARDTKVLRDAVDNQLVPTDIHFAFVDPTNPVFLHLTTQMKPPQR